MLTVDDIDSGRSVTILVEGLLKHPEPCAEPRTDQQDSAPKLPATLDTKRLPHVAQGALVMGVHMRERKRNRQFGILQCSSGTHNVPFDLYLASLPFVRGLMTAVAGPMQ